MGSCGYHFTGKPIARSAGRSAVKHAAYIAAEKYLNQELGEVCNYTRKRGVEAVFHYAPKDAPAWAHAVETGWNAVEAVENRKNSTLALDYVAAFPHQLNAAQRAFIIKDFLREEFQRRGFMATGAVHEPDSHGDQRNYHAHIMFSYRGLDKDGWAKNKDRYFSSNETREEALIGLKKKWAELGARQLDRMGLTVEAERWRHGYQTLPEQRELAQARGDTDYVQQCFREPTRHLGPAASAMQRKGQRTERGAEYEATQERNALRADLAALEKKQRHLDRHLTRLDALELEQAHQQAHAADQSQTQRTTTHYAIDKLAEIAEAQARQDAAARKAFDDAYQRMQDDENENRLRR
jgi:hypothetical protein